MSQPPVPEPRREGWLLARLFGVPVYVNGSWLIASLVIAVLFAPYVTEQLPQLGGAAYLVAFAFAVLLGLSVLVHELAHSVVALAFGLRVRQITLHLLGGVSEIHGGSDRPWADLVVAVVGPLASLGLAAASWGLWQVLPDGTVVSLVVWQLTVTNLIVGVFNLLPGLPLDGGRILRDLVWGVSRRERLGTQVAGWAGRALAVVLALLALLPLARGRTDLVWLAWGMLLAGFIWIQAGHALRGARLRDRLPTITARSLTRRAIPVPSDLPVAEALRLLEQGGAGGLVTVDARRQPVGIVNEAAIAALPVERRPWVSVGSVSRTLQRTATVPVDAQGEGMLQLMDEHPAPEYLVVEADGSIYGVLSHQDVTTALAALQHSASGPLRRG